MPRYDAEIDLPTLNPHPRLICTDDVLNHIKELISQDQRAKVWYDAVQAHARAALEEPPSRYEIPDGKRLLATSRRVLRRTGFLGLSYRLDRDEAYKERLWQELQAAAEFPDWNPSHFLDTAEMSNAFALAYDWLYHDWSQRQRRILAGALLEKGLRPGVQAYEEERPQFTWWVDVTHNWNVVCNGGLGMGALALAEVEPELCQRIIRGTVASIPQCVREFDPDGGWDEGPAYWSYTIRYLIPYLAALESAAGTDYGLSESEGLAKTGDYPLYVTGPSGRSFNYGDASEGAPYRAEMHWLAQRFHRPQWAAWHAARAPLQGGSGRLRQVRAADRSLLWYDPELTAQGGRQAPPLDHYFRKVELVSMRSRWADPDALFAAFKAGDNTANHGDLDLGSFVLEAQGVRWAVELPAEDYNLPGYFNTSEGGRWQYYRTRAEGQNTLLINPGAGPEQDPAADCRITAFASSSQQALAVADLTQAYAGHGAATVSRGLALVDHRSQFLVQDELQLEEVGTVYWLMHTLAKVQIVDGGRGAVLSQDGRRLAVQILAPDAAVLSAGLARPLPGAPDPKGQDRNQGVSRLCVRLDGVKSLRLAVRMVPVQGDGADGVTEALASAVPNVVSISTWGEERSL